MGSPVFNSFAYSAFCGLSIKTSLVQYIDSLLIAFRVSDVSSITLKMPNIHFLPVNLSSKDNPVIVKVHFLPYYEHDTYKNN